MTDTDSRTTVIDTDTTASPPSADRTFPPSAEFAANANLNAEAYERAAADPEAFWAEQANRLTWATPFTAGAGLVRRPAREVVRRRQLNVAVQLRGPARRRRARRHGRDPLGGRTRRLPHHHLRGTAGRGLQDRERAALAGPEGRRPGGDLPADDPRGGVRDAGLRPPRPGPRRRLRRVLRRGAARPGSATPRPGW